MGALQIASSPSRSFPAHLYPHPYLQITASQCFTKYKWRSAEDSGEGPQIVATQVRPPTLPARGSTPKRG